jgi:hypothetical protein
MPTNRMSEPSDLELPIGGNKVAVAGASDSVNARFGQCNRVQSGNRHPTRILCTRVHFCYTPPVERSY